MDKPMVTLHPFWADFWHWPTRRAHRPTTLCRPCDPTAHGRKPRSRQFLMGLRVECMKVEEQFLLLENPLLKILLLEDERSDWVNPIFDEKREAWQSFILCSQCCWSKHQNFFSILEWGPTRSGTSYIILGHIYKEAKTRHRCFNYFHTPTYALVYILSNH
jgi:hypothetical protein